MTSRAMEGVDGDMIIGDNAKRSADVPAAMTVWERVAATTWGTYVTGVEKRAIVKASSLAGKPAKALEIGCEGGRWSKMLADVGWKMTCVDVDREALAVCQRRLPDAICIQVDKQDKRIPCDSKSASLLLCVEVAAVIQSEWFLPEAHRVLEDGGILVGTFWNRLSWRGVQARIRFQLNRRPNADFYSRSYSTWRRALTRIGFQIAYQEGFCWSPIGRSSNSALVPVLGQFERRFGLHRLPVISPWVAFIAKKT